MKRLVLAAAMLAVVSHPVLAGSRLVLNGSRGSTEINQSNTTVINNGTISGGSSKTGLTVKGSNNTVVNNGKISGKTGISMSGGSSSIVNNGTISASSSGGASSSAVGISQGN